MDIQQLRSWIFELYDPFENQRQYVVFDAARGNLLIDVPEYSERALRLIRGTGSAGLLVVTNAARAAQADPYRQALGVQIAAHADDAAAVRGGADVVFTDEQELRPDARAIRVTDGTESATVVLLSKTGGILVCGDLDLASDAARRLLDLQFSTVLSANRPPMWNAGRDTVMRLQDELPQARKSFGILLPPPWDREHVGKLQDKMYPNEPIVPSEETVTREAAMGPTTLVVSRTTPDKQARAPKPLPAEPK